MQTNSLARAVAVAGPKNLSVGILIMRLAYWSKYAKIVRNDQLWVVKSSEEWMAETQLTRYQYVSALKWLKDQGYVVTEQHLFGHRNLTHMRMTARLIDRLAPHENQTPEYVADQTPECTVGQTLYKHSETEIKIQTDVLCENVISAHEDTSKMTGKTIKNPNPYAGLSSKEIFEKAKSPPVLSKADTVETFWQKLFSAKTGKVAYSVSHKDQALLKAVIKQITREGVAHVVEHWGSFVAKVKNDKGWSVYPNQPTIPFLRQHVDTAIELVKNQKPKPLPPNNPEQAQPKIEAPASKPPVQLIAPEPAYKPMTKEELLKLMENEDD